MNTFLCKQHILGKKTVVLKTWNANFFNQVHTSNSMIVVDFILS